MAENKTRSTDCDVEAFIASVPDATRAADARTLTAMMARLSGEPPALWGTSIIGFGRYRYRYDSGREGTMSRIGFSPRKAELVLYVADGFPRHAELLARLGKHRTGTSCLYVKRLSDIDMAVLEELVADALAHMDATYPRD